MPPAGPMVPGCLLFLVQATPSMAESPGSWSWSFYPAPRKLDAALVLVNGVVDRLVDGLVVGPGSVPTLDVAVVAYAGAGTDSGVRAILPGSSAESPWVPLEVLRERAAGIDRAGLVREWVAIEPGGEEAAETGLRAAYSLAQQWLGQHPAGAPPLVVHVTDGRNCSEGVVRLGRSLGALTTSRGNTILAHCLLTAELESRVTLPARAAQVAGGPGELLYQASSPLAASEGGKRVAARAFGVNDLPFKQLVRLLQRLATAREQRPEPQVTGPAGAVLQHRALWLQKGGNSAEEWEDAFAVNPARHLAVVSDGAGFGIFCRSWADILTRRFAEGQPVLAAPDVSAWLQDCRQRWFDGLHFDRLRYTQQMKVRNGGAGATLLALQLGLAPVRSGRQPVAPGLVWRAWAVGDSCLFWIQANRLRATFPAVSSEDFTVCTSLLQTRPDSPVMPLLTAGGMGKTGDFFLLLTDALAQMIMRRCEAGSEPDWEEFWHLDETRWQEWIVELRDRDEMVDDDCTLLAVRLLSGS